MYIQILLSNESEPQEMVLCSTFPQPLQRSAQTANHRWTAHQRQHAFFRTSVGDGSTQRYHLKFKTFNTIQSTG